jgi:nitrate reductase gamma subunit
MMAIQIFSYLCFVICVAAVGVRIAKHLNMPLHFRWELYPVQHEPGEKASYGGSYMEEVNWWEKERPKSLINEIKYMVPEILLLRGLRMENRALWNVSFPFHFGIYLLFKTLFLLLLGAIAMVAGGKISPGGGLFSALIYYLTILTGFFGLILATWGGIGLIHRRITDPNLRNYSSPLDFLNLFLFLLFLGVSLPAWLLFDPSFEGARGYIYLLITFGNRPEGSGGRMGLFGGASAFLASLLFAYIPLTHMSHMFMKYFMYHSIRWEDSPNLKGGRLEAEILNNLGFKPTWVAPHIGADGKKTWADLAASKAKEG